MSITKNDTIVDFNIIANGETATSLQRLLQEIDIIMTTADSALITNYQPKMGLERFLFKTGVNNEFVASEVQKLIYANISPNLGFNILVSSEFLKGAASKDILLITVNVDSQDAHEQLSYTIS